MTSRSNPANTSFALPPYADTVVVPLQNGVPFWYFHRHGGPHEGRAVESADPGGRIARAIDARRIIGSVVFVAAERVAPGEIRHRGYNRFPMGELDGSRSARIQALSQAFESSGLEAPILAEQPVSTPCICTIASSCRTHERRASRRTLA